MEESILRSLQCPSCGTTTSGPGPRKRHWFQINIALERKRLPVTRAGKMMFGRWMSWCETWRSEEILDSFWFIRKPPDVRIRFSARSGCRRQLRVALAEAVETLRAERVIRSAIFAVYEPELFRFGGSEMMECVHDYFHHDTLAWCDHVRIRDARSCQLEPWTWSWLLLRDLFARTLAGAEEEWDVWCRLAVIHGIPTSRAKPKRAQRMGALRATRAEHDLLLGYREANERFSKKVGSLAERNRLQVGIRGLLASTALFHLNRYGLDTSSRRSLIEHGLASAGAQAAVVASV